MLETSAGVVVDTAALLLDLVVMVFTVTVSSAAGVAEVVDARASSASLIRRAFRA